MYDIGYTRVVRCIAFAFSRTSQIRCAAIRAGRDLSKETRFEAITVLTGATRPAENDVPAHAPFTGNQSWTTLLLP